jgi:hypothetical protein
VSVVQPWVGTRVTLVLSPHWRLVMNAQAQGLGLPDGSQGWGAGIDGSYAFNEWLNLTLGFQALHTERAQGNTSLAGAERRSFSLTAYGPVVGVGFRF